MSSLCKLLSLFIPICHLETWEKITVKIYGISGPNLSPTLTQELWWYLKFICVSADPVKNSLKKVWIFLFPKCRFALAIGHNRSAEAQKKAETAGRVRRWENEGDSWNFAKGITDVPRGSWGQVNLLRGINRVHFICFLTHLFSQNLKEFSAKDRNFIQVVVLQMLWVHQHLEHDKEQNNY